MYQENNQWDLADQDFKVWLNDKKQESRHPLSDILKSTYLAFRQRQSQKIKNICQLAFDYSIEIRVISDEIFFEPVAQYHRKFVDSEPLETSESVRKARIYKDNEQIINGILLGDQKTFNDLYEYDFPGVVRFVTKNSGNLENAKDLFQDALIILIEKIYDQKLDLSCTLSTYIFSICRNLWMEQLRRNKKEILLQDDFDHLCADIAIPDCDSLPDIYDEVCKAIDALGAPGKRLLDCYYYKKMNWQEISDLLGYASPASARNQKYKYLERIRKLVLVENSY